jgi:hypothetical protein
VIIAWSVGFQVLGQIRIGGNFHPRFFFLAFAADFALLSYLLAKIYQLRRISTLALRHRKVALLRRLAIPHDLLRASYVERFTTCGKANCVCVQGQKHGPFYYLVSGLKPGNVLKFLLKTPSQRQNGQRGVAHYQEFWQGLEELSQINAELLRRDEPLQSE